MNKTKILNSLNISKFYQELIPSLEINGKPEALGLCPFHDDHSPSLSVNVETGLFRCFACDAKGDVFAFYQKYNGCDFSAALRGVGGVAGIAESDIKPKVVATFKYTDEAGNLLYTKERIEPGRNGKRKEFIFKHLEGGRCAMGRGCDPVLYHLPDVLKSECVFIAEGEAKADLLHSWGLVATCLDSGANSPVRDEYIQVLGGKEKVVILPDDDKPGREYASKIASVLYGKVKELKVVELPGLPGKGDIIDWAKLSGNDKSKLLELVENAPEWLSVTGVTEVTEVTDSSEELIRICDFPINVFPSELQKFVNGVSISMDIGCEVVATIALTILSASIGNTVKVSPKRDYYVAPFLWAGIVLPPGAGKSPTINALVNPVKKMQSTAFLKYKQGLKEYETALNAFKKDKTGTIEHPEVPKMEQFYVSDSTVEALADIFECQPRGVLNYQDELSGLILGMDQYKGKGNDRQHFLDLWNCTSWKVDRKGKHGFIPNVGMGVIGGIQPIVLTEVFGNDSFHDGFIHRFIFTCPESKPLRFNRKSINETGLAYWEDLLYGCLGIPLEINDSGFVKSKILTLTDGALDLWEKFYNEYGQLATILPMNASGFIPKLYLYSLKFAGILHIIGNFNTKHISPIISEKTVQDAIDITRYYFGQISKVLRLYNEGNKAKKYHKRIINAIYSLRGNVINGKLELSKIVEEYNRGLPIHAHLTPEKTSNALNNEIGLTTQKSTGNRSYLLWEDEKIKKLFRTTVTTVTTVTTPPEKEQNGVTEVTEVTDDCEEKNENGQEAVSNEPINLDALGVEL